MQPSFSNTTTNSFNTNTSGPTFGPQPKSEEVKFEGNILGNAREDLQTIGADITTLVGAIFGYDKQARQALVDTFNTIKDDPKQVKMLADAMLSTYNLSVDDFGEMPLGEMVGNVMSGAWKHPITALIDVTSLASAAGVKIPKTIKSKLGKIDDADVRLKLAEEVTKDNVRMSGVGSQFIRDIEAIESKYSPEVISRSMQAIETLGFKNAPKELRECMIDLSKANDTYKQFTSMAGAEMLDDIDLAAKELLAREHKVSFQSLNEWKNLQNTDLYKDVVKYVQENDVRPLFHLKPKVNVGDIVDVDKVETGLLKRAYGTMEYDDAARGLTNKATEFVDKVVRSQTLDSIENVNAKITAYNKLNNTNVKPLEQSRSIWNNTLLNELNSELKKVMLSSGTYLGANVLTTTLSILNNFDVNAFAKTFKNLPRFRMVNLPEAKTPILNLVSRVNNRLYRPIASIDKYLENIATEYINNYGVDKAKFLQSTIPSKVVATDQVQAAIKSLVPFGNYPLAAIKEVSANVTGRPTKALAYNQLAKVGEQLNIQAQQREGIQKIDPTKVLRKDEQDKVIQRSTIVTPIQAANMFLLGTQGDAVQIPIIQFLNKLMSGKGDPNVFVVNGKSYRVVNGKIQTNKGEFDLLPSLAYIGRNLLGPVQFYNQVIVPLMTEKYIKDETKLLNRMVNDSQYSNMTMAAQRKVTDKAKEKLGKRVLGTYEYNYYDESKVSKSIQRNIRRQQVTRRSIERALEK